jgi:heme/copper-type cytochrome/quinol oxidase subunit 1
MKFTPHSLFAITSTLLLALGTIFASRTFDIILHDSFYVIGYLPISISFSLISGLMALIYFILQKTGKRINQKIGFWHWSLFNFGWVLLAISFNLEQLIKNYNVVEYAIMGLLLGGLTTFLISFLTFAFGVFKAFTNKDL